MEKKILLVFIFSTLCLIFLISAHSQEDMRSVSADPFVKPRRPPAVFQHDEHNGQAGIEECHVCHHVYGENGKLVEDESSEDQSCSECHELARSGNKPALMKAFHANCKGCHKARKKGPLMCGQCHVRS
ncbi:MAG: cytochrome c3 family protein [bacterium]|nr:cytochrome c3 family protein [bacterium]